MRRKDKAPVTTTMPCALCAGTMRHRRTIPAAGELPELQSFQCEQCGHLRTVESASIAIAASEARAAAAA